MGAVAELTIQSGGDLFSASNDSVPAAVRAEALRGVMYREQMKVVDAYAYKKELAEETGQAPRPPPKPRRHRPFHRSGLGLGNGGWAGYM
jgi:hypothetical protein